MPDSPDSPGHPDDHLDTSQGPPAGIDPAVPSPARMYNYFLGGRDNFPADRLAAEKALSVVPDGRRIALANRYFLAQATLRMADRGITQFLDLGTGIPTSPAVHEVAREITSSACVAYVDNDPVVIAHNKAQLAAIETVRVVHGDIRQPEAVLADPAIRRLIDFSRPVGLLMVAVLHFITDDQDPGRIVAAFTRELAPGSYLALSHISSDGTSPEAITTIRDTYANAAAPAVFRTAAQIRAFFDGFAWEPPGLIDVVDWFPYSKVFTATPPTVQVLGGLGCKKPTANAMPHTGPRQPGDTRGRPGPEYDQPARQMARRLQQAHPGWLVLWGTYGREFWAYPTLPVPRGTILHSPDADTLATRIREIRISLLPQPGPLPHR